MTDDPPAPHRRRRGYYAIAAWSALTLLAVVAWSWSYRSVGVLAHPTRPGDRACVTSEMGLLVFEWHAPPPGGEPDPPPPAWVYMYSPVPRRWPARWDWGGFDAYRSGYRHYLRLPPSPVYGAVVPYWFVAGLAGAGLARSVARWRRDRDRVGRAAAGQCAACGYDLRATPEPGGSLLGRCPECGTAAYPLASPPVRM